MKIEISSLNKQHNKDKLELKQKYEEQIDQINKEKLNMMEELENLKVNAILVEYKPGQEFQGIIKYLTDKTGGNIHDNSTIEVTSNSIDCYHHPKYLLNQDNLYGSKQGEQDLWICFDFKNMEIEITEYSIKSSHDQKNIGHVKNWFIEISNNGQKWTKIDEHSNSDELNGPNIIKTYHTKPAKFSRYVRFHHIGEYWGVQKGMYLFINSFEFYGRLKNFEQH